MGLPQRLRATEPLFRGEEGMGSGEWMLFSRLACSQKAETEGEVLLHQACESPREKQEGGSGGAATRVTPVPVLECPPVEGSPDFRLVLQSAPTASACMFLGGGLLRCCWRFVFASLARARSGKEDLHGQTLTGRFLQKWFCWEGSCELADFGYLQQLMWGMIVREAVDFLLLLHS